MSAPSGPASPQQIRLLIGLSGLPLLAGLVAVIVYVAGYQAVAGRSAAWVAFVVALVPGAIVGWCLVRFVPLFGGTVPRVASLRPALPYGAMVALLAAVVIGRLVHQAVPVPVGYLAGFEAVMASVLLIRSRKTG
jgi:hypothetical protein